MRVIRVIARLDVSVRSVAEVAWLVDTGDVEALP